MKLVPLLAIGAALALPSAPSSAQDLGPIINPSEVGRSTVVSNIPRNQTRARSDTNNGRQPLRSPQTRQPTKEQIAACANKERLASRHGAGNPGVQKLYQLCREVGL